MKVIIVFQIDNVDPDSEQAHQLIEELQDECEVIRTGFNNCSFHIDEVIS